MRLFSVSVIIIFETRRQSTEKVVVGMSGGVDSSVAAYLLKKEGYDVIGLTIKTWAEEGREEESANIFSDASKVCDTLGIPLVTVDSSELFKENVVDPFVREYAAGRTPNPCILCNPLVKWATLLSYAESYGAGFVATGHYAEIYRDSEGNVALKKSVFDRKDQTYALYRLSSDALRRTIFPLGKMDKENVRKIAEEIGIHVAAKKDSEEICFIPDNDHASFLKRQSQEGAFPKGDFVDCRGNVLGTHEGIGKYTIGQRKGLGIAYGHPLYVTEIRADKNQVVLGENEDLFRRTVYVESVVFSECFRDFEGSATGKIRYGQKPAPCKVRKCNDGMRSYSGGSFSGGERKCCGGFNEELLEVTFESPVRAVTPGQSLVLYQNDLVIGGGIISSKNLPDTE